MIATGRSIDCCMRLRVQKWVNTGPYEPVAGRYVLTPTTEELTPSQQLPFGANCSMIAAVRANYLMVITCGEQACSYRLPQVTAWDFFRRPFALRSGEIPYPMIIGVEKRREAIKWGQTCTAVCLIIRDEPLRTFVRGAVGDHQWVEA